MWLQLYSCCELSAPLFPSTEQNLPNILVWGDQFLVPRPKFSLDQNFHGSSCIPHFNLKGSSIPTVSELLCCSFRWYHARLTDGRCSSFILHIEYLPSVNLVLHDPRLQHSSSNIVGIEEHFRLNVVCSLKITPSRNVAHLLRIIMKMDINTRYISGVGEVCYNIYTWYLSAVGEIC